MKTVDERELQKKITKKKNKQRQNRAWGTEAIVKV